MDSSALAAHEREHHSFKCAFLCAGRFRSDAALQQHMRETHVHCELCGQWIESAFRMEIHTELDHPACLSCGEQFKVPIDAWHTSHTTSHHRAHWS